MKRILVAFATDNGKNFMERHFGDANFYDIYKIEGNQVNLLKRINNTTEEEDMHADPKKAKGVAHLLLNEKVQVVVSKVFGPNIIRIKKKFVCILIQEDLIENSLEIIRENLKIIFQEWEKGENRNFLKL